MSPTDLGYSHIQRSPICLLLYTFGVGGLLGGAALSSQAPVALPVAAVGVVMCLLGAAFQHLKVSDQEDRLAIQFGPLPLFRTSVPYSDIERVEVGKTMILDGLGIHMSARGGWVWNIWGRDCVVVHRRKGTLRIGTDDAEQLAGFLESKIG